MLHEHTNLGHFISMKMNTSCQTHYFLISQEYHPRLLKSFKIIPSIQYFTECLRISV